MVGAIEMSATSPPDQLRSFLGRFSVFYQVHRESAILRHHGIRQVAYTVELYGSDESEPPLCPGDERSHEIFLGLCLIARHVLAGGGDGCRIDMGDFDAALHYLDGSKGPGSVQLELSIRHPHKFDGPLDTAQRRALDEVIERLEALGVHHVGTRRIRAR